MSHDRAKRALRTVYGGSRSLVLASLAVMVSLTMPVAAAAHLGQRSLTIVTYNIHHGVGVDGALDLERIAAVLEATGADVIALQEVDRHWSSRSAFADQVDELARLLDMSAVYGANLDLDPEQPGAARRQYGTAILSAEPILAWSNTPLPNLGGEQRGLLEVLLDLEGVRVRVLNTHLQHNNAAERAAQTAAIAERIDRVTEPLVLVGDLNARPPDAELDVLQTRLQDVWELVGEGPGYTLPAEAPNARIDYVLVDRCADVVTSAVGESLASDHLPLTAKLRFHARRECDRELVPLARAHAHNDYEHEQPLFDALAQGFTSVEADIWLVDGQLLVAHDLTDVRPERTLEALYLEPLRDLARTQRGRVHASFPHSVQLLIDIKSEAEPSYRALHELLAKYRNILTLFTPYSVHERAVTAVVSGNRPRELMAAQRARYAGYDGRSVDLGAGAPASFIPLVSDRWSNLFTWAGVGPMPEQERAKLTAFVVDAHANGQRVRFWATPEDLATREAVWSELIAAGVDYINTDDLAGLRAFLLADDPHPTRPEVDWSAPSHRRE